MKKFLLAIAGLAFISAAFPALSGTDMLTAAGTATAPISSTCPATFSGTCASGWFSVRGTGYVIVQVSEDAGTATVILYHRIDATGPTDTLKTWTNPAATQTPVVLWPPSGDIKITVSAIGGGGTVKAKVEAYRLDGTRLW